MIDDAKSWVSNTSDSSNVSGSSYEEMSGRDSPDLQMLKLPNPIGRILQRLQEGQRFSH
jgi:hypothetical protein